MSDWKRFVTEESGMGTVEVILILVVLVGLVIIFRDQMNSLVSSIFKKVTKKTNTFS